MLASVDRARRPPLHGLRTAADQLELPLELARALVVDDAKPAEGRLAGPVGGDLAGDAHGRERHGGGDPDLEACHRGRDPAVAVDRDGRLGTHERRGTQLVRERAHVGAIPAAVGAAGHVGPSIARSSCDSSPSSSSDTCARTRSQVDVFAIGSI